MAKLIAVDMDGTLLNDSGNITERTVSAIGRAVDCGAVVTLSTGRPIQGVDRFIRLLNLKTPVITYNGAMIVEPITRKVLFSKTLEVDDAVAILNEGNKIGITMCVWVDDQLFVNAINGSVDDYKKLSGVEPILIDDCTALVGRGITKILWYDNPSVIATVQQQFNSINLKSVTYCTSKPYFLEFFNSGVSKATALQTIADMYNIDRKEIIAIGDGENDLAMIDFAGLGVAMANAPDSVKGYADYVTQNDNNNDGVAEVIEKFVLANGI